MMKTTLPALVIIALGVLLLWFVLWWLPGYPTRDAAERASVRELSRELRRYPNLQNYRAYFTLRRGDRAGRGGALWYAANYEEFGLETDPDSGWSVRWTNVDARTIHAVAATNGALASFGKPYSYCTNVWPP
jgi:hypothetical protein